MSAERLLVEMLDPESVRQCSIRITEEMQRETDEGRRRELLVFARDLLAIRSRMLVLLRDAQKKLGLQPAKVRGIGQLLGRVEEAA